MTNVAARIISREDLTYRSAGKRSGVVGQILRIVIVISSTNYTIAISIVTRLSFLEEVFGYPLSIFVAKVTVCRLGITR